MKYELRILKTSFLPGRGIINVRNYWVSLLCPAFGNLKLENHQRSLSACHLLISRDIFRRRILRSMRKVTPQLVGGRSRSLKILSWIISSHYLATTNEDLLNRRIYVHCSCTDL
jgi:hypothetical protein